MNNTRFAQLCNEPRYFRHCGSSDERQHWLHRFTVFRVVCCVNRSEYLLNFSLCKVCRQYSLMLSEMNCRAVAAKCYVLGVT